MIDYLTRVITNRIGKLESFYDFSQEHIDYKISTKKMKQLGLFKQPQKENVHHFLDDWEYY